MSEEKKEDNLENAIHEVERFVRLNDRERALMAVEHLKTFTGDPQEKGMVPRLTATEQFLKRIAESLEFHWAVPTKETVTEWKDPPKPKKRTH